MKKIYHLEGIRGLGALIVYVCHFQILFSPDFYHTFFEILNHYLPQKMSNFIVSLSNLMNTGNMFLHIFWALSAYVIFKKFFEYETKFGQLLSNSIKRYFRLMVPSAVSIFLAYIVYRLGFMYVTHIPVKTLQQNLYTIPPSFLHAAKTSFWNTMFNYDYFSSYNGPLWTIQREFYGCVFCFALFGIIGKVNNRSIFYAIIFTIIFCLQMYWLNSFLFGYYLCDMDFSSQKEDNLAARKIQQANSFLIKHQSLAIFLFIILFLGGRMLIYKFLEQLDMVNCFLCFFFIFVSLRTDIITRIMSFKIFTFLGRLSFGFYLLHFPFICSFSSWLYLKYNMTTNADILILFVISTAICLLLAQVFYKYVDVKSIVFASKISAYVDKLIAYKITVEVRFEINKKAS